MNITPEMLLGALVIFAVVLLFAVIFVVVWARSALKFGKGFQSFTAKRERNTINVQAVFDDAAPAADQKPTAAKLSDWLSGRNIPTASNGESSK